MIEVHDLTKRFGGRAVVEAVSFTVGKGELLALVGGSGSGKTTTLRMINRLVEPTSGRVVIDGDDTESIPETALRRRIGYVFQRVGLFPHLTVAENVAITPSLLGWSADDIRARVDELLRIVELDPDIMRDRLPAALSGGEQQRVGVARALAARPKLMLLDEPFGALDPLTRDRLQESFRRIRAQVGFTAVFVTHDMTEALMLADQIAVMMHGRLLQIGQPADVLQAPATEEVARMVETPMRHARIVDELLSGAKA